MEYNTRINRVKISLFGLFFASFFIPVYGQVFNGTLYKVSISNLNAGLFFMIFFPVLMISTVVVFFYKNEYFTYSYLITVGFMIILLLMLLFLKQDGSHLRFGFYLELLIVSMIVIAHFSEKLTFLIIDKMKHYLYQTYLFIKKYTLIGIKKLKKVINDQRDKKKNDNKEGAEHEEIS